MRGRCRRVARLKRFALAVSTALLFSSASSLAQAAAYGSPEVAVLSSADVRLYREVLAEERAGHFRAAAKDFDRISDTSLEGYVQAEHYLSPRARRVPVQDLV